MTVSSALVTLPPPQTDGLYRVMMVCTGNICRSAMAKVVLRDRLASVGAARGAESGGAALSASSDQPGVSNRLPGSGELSPSRSAASQYTQRTTSRRAPVPGTSVIVLSAGTSDEEYGNPIDPRARRVLIEAGYTGPTAAEAIETHYAHRISDAEILGNDLLLTMTAHHYRELRRRGERLGADPSRVMMYRALDPEAFPVPGASSAPLPAESPGLVPDLPDPWYGSLGDFADTLQVVERVSDELAARLRPWV